MPAGSDSGQSASTGDGFEHRYSAMTPEQFQTQIEEDTGLRLYMVGFYNFTNGFKCIYDLFYSD